MKNYFIFLDLDGTLWDIYNNPYLVMKSTHFKKSSIQAVNNLINGLQNKGYDPHLVITGRFREDWNACSNALYSQGINQTIPMYPLYIGDLSRGERIGLFLHDFYNNKSIPVYRKITLLDRFKTNYNKKLDNYVVIDDTISDLQNIPRTNLIKTSMYQGALDEHKISSYLEIVAPYKDKNEENYENI